MIKRKKINNNKIKLLFFTLFLIFNNIKLCNEKKNKIKKYQTIIKLNRYFSVN